MRRSGNFKFSIQSLRRFLNVQGPFLSPAIQDKRTALLNTLSSQQSQSPEAVTIAHNLAA